MLNEKGHEVLDDTPIAVPLKIKARSQYDQIRQFIRQELSAQAQKVGVETFQEADDFDVGDDYDPRSPWELDFDQETADLNLGAFEQQHPLADKGGPALAGGEAPEAEPKAKVEAQPPTD